MRHIPRPVFLHSECPLAIREHRPGEIRRNVRQLVHASANPWLTGVCCINVDAEVRDDQIAALLDEVRVLREEYAGGARP